MLDFNKMDRDRDRDEDDYEDESESEWFIAAKNRAANVGIALMIAAILCVVANGGSLLVLSALKRQQPPAEPPKNMSPEEKQQFERGQKAAPFFDFLCVGAVSLVYLPVLLGGIGLQRGSGRAMGLTAAACTMLPCSPGFLIGLPIGIWALVVLNNEEVKSIVDPENWTAG